jgi:hypothetical protein
MMPLCAISIKQGNRRKIGSTNQPGSYPGGMYTSSAVTMLRSPYSCMSAGVLFVNAASIVIDNLAKKLRVSYMFSEWLGEVASVLAEFGRKLAIISMRVPRDELQVHVRVVRLPGECPHQPDEQSEPGKGRRLDGLTTFVERP